MGEKGAWHYRVACITITTEGYYCSLPACLFPIHPPIHLPVHPSCPFIHHRGQCKHKEGHMPLSPFIIWLSFNQSTFTKQTHTRTHTYLLTYSHSVSFCQPVPTYTHLGTSRIKITIFRSQLMLLPLPLPLVLLNYVNWATCGSRFLGSFFIGFLILPSPCGMFTVLLRQSLILGNTTEKQWTDPHRHHHYH